VRFQPRTFKQLLARAELSPNAIQRTKSTGIVVDEERAVSLEHEEARGRMADEPHCPFGTGLHLER
jgi:hypothetical protein